jgi:Putative Actinobacterial Holin-X, holin superfamily III
MRNLMPKPHDEQIPFPQLLKQLAGDGVRVIDAELSLAKAEATTAVRGYLAAAVLGVVCFAVAIAALIIFAQAGAYALMPYFANSAYAYLSVGLVLVAMSIVLALFANHLLSRKTRPVGMIFKWLNGDRATK